MSAATPVLSRYPSAIADLGWVRLGSGGGFSGASLWRGDLTGTPAFALKAWPLAYPRERLETVHRWMRQARECGLAFVPTVVATLDGRTCVEHAGRVWDIAAWAPGVANFHAEPSDAKLATACAALAALHRAWVTPGAAATPCPAVRRRLDVLSRPLPQRGREHNQRLREIVQLAQELLPSRIAAARVALAKWESHPVSVQPCLCDVWHDHVLFTGNAVTGLIDYGAMKLDHPAVDLARLLGDLVGEDAARRRLGLEAYRIAGSPLPIDEAFVALLDRSGVVCAVLHWLNRIEANAITSDPDAVTQRLERLIARLEHVFPLSGADRFNAARS